jgi:23S rRNA pseudouridine1911/1915/1917 synthase
MKLPMILHCSVTETQNLSSFLEQNYGLLPERSQFLLELGSIYYNQKRIPVTQIAQEISLRPGDYLRVHQEPRRFRADEINWRALILFQNADFVVINKPKGIPTHASVDNWKENCVFQIQKVLGREVFVTHRLDVPTDGVLIFALTKNFQRNFNEALQLGLVRKIYGATSNHAPKAEGLVVHYMKPSLYSPKEVSSEFQKGWQKCILEIISLEAERPPQPGYFMKIQLHTGRTHQIRAQLAAVGAPLRGDDLYNPATYGLKIYGGEERIELSATQIEFALPEDPHRVWKFEKPSVAT